MNDSQETIDGFIIDYESDFGSGAFSTCYRCYNKKHQGPLCVKIILPSVQISHMFDREIEVIQRISQIDCNFLVKILHISQQSKKCYFFMEYCQQGDLQNFIKLNETLKKTLSIQEILLILSQIINGYKQLYDFGIIHRDIKPANILLGNNGCFQLADYGMAKILQDPCLKLQQSFVGTPNYAAPQVIIDGIYSNKCDVYSLGVLIYELVYKQLPIKAHQYFQFFEAIKNTKDNKIKITNFPPNLGGTQAEKKQLNEFLTRSLVYEESSRISWEELFQLYPDPTNTSIFSTIQMTEQFNLQEFSHNLIDTKEIDHQLTSYVQKESSIKGMQSLNNNQITQNNSQSGQVQQFFEVKDYSQNQFFPSAEIISLKIKSHQDTGARSAKLIKKKSIIFCTWQDDLLEKGTFAEKLNRKIKNVLDFIAGNNQILSFTPYYATLHLLQLLVNGYQYSCYLNIYYLLFKRNKSNNQLQILKDLYEIEQDFLNQQINQYLNNQAQIMQVLYLKQQFQNLKKNFKKQIQSFKEFQQNFKNFEFNQDITFISKKESLYSPQFYYKKYKEKFDQMNLNFDLEAEYDYLEDHTIKHLAFSIKFFKNEEQYQILTEILQANQKSVVEYSEVEKSMLAIINKYFKKKQQQIL